jgi:hypothetical protein
MLTVIFFPGPFKYRTASCGAHSQLLLQVICPEVTIFVTGARLM